MSGDYPDDTFTQSNVENELDRAGLKHYDKGRYLLAQCPTHEDRHPSVQIYKDDWFVNCHATCGRFHITKAFPSLREAQRGGYSSGANYPARRSESNRDTDRKKEMTEHKYIEVDLMSFWEKLPEIPQDHFFKGIPIEELTELGWRYDPNGHRYFIPYFSASRESIPFAQWRNLGDGPRFNFWKDAKPTCYGTWNLDNPKLFVVEGTSDAAVLDYCLVPWIALPSAASGELMKKMANYCKENEIELVYAGDNDIAGDKLKAALDEVMPYRIKQPPSKYKDWGEFFEAEGQSAVSDYCSEELIGKQIEVPVVEEVDEDLELENVLAVFPGAENIETSPTKK